MGTLERVQQHQRHEVDLPGCPSWVDRALIEATIRTWQPYYDAELTAEDALEIIQNVGHLYDTLGLGTLAASGGLAP